MKFNDVDAARKLEELGLLIPWARCNAVSWCEQCTRDVCGTRDMGGVVEDCPRYEGPRPIRCLPTLSQMLAELASMRYNFMLVRENAGYKVGITWEEDDIFEGYVVWFPWCWDNKVEYADSPEEAVCATLLYLLSHVE